MLARNVMLGVVLTVSICVDSAPAQFTSRVSVSSTGIQGNDNSRAPSDSALARYTAFKSDADSLVFGDTNAFGDVFLHDRYHGTTVLISRDPTGPQANGESFNPSISNDGRCTAFYSQATNLVAGDVNACTDVFVYDQQLDVVTLVSKSSSGTQGNGDCGVAEISGN